MANYQYSSDSINAALFHAGEPTSGTSDYEAAALEYVNDCYYQIYVGGSELNPDIQEDWWWLYAQQSITLVPEYTTGTVAVTEGSTSATLSATYATSLAGRHIRITDHVTPYKISAHTAGTAALTLDLLAWLPRGENNAAPVISDLISLGPGNSLRWGNVLTALFALGPDSAGALMLVATTESVIGLSRTYNIPAGESAGTFGQGLPAVRATEMIMGTEPQRITFLSENDDSRANVGCVNGWSEPVTITSGCSTRRASRSRPRPWTWLPTPTIRSTGSSRTTHRSTATSMSGPTASMRSTTATARCSTT